MPHKHLFLTNRGEPVPRWLDAFPGARVARPDSADARCGATLVWLHLDAEDQDVARQVSTALEVGQGAPVVVLANAPSQEEGLACLEAGAVGYVAVLSVPEMLRQVVSVVENGGLWVGPELLKRLRRALAAQPLAIPVDARLAPLSKREKEVARAVAMGASNKEIARQMGITERTVKAHLSTIFERLQVRDRLQLSILVNGESSQAREAVG